MADDKTWELPYDKAIEVVRRGFFDEVRAALKGLGFVFSETKDPNHTVCTITRSLEETALPLSPEPLIALTAQEEALTVFRDMTRARQNR